MDIEKLATSAVTGYISKTDYLSPFINEGIRNHHGMVIFTSLIIVLRANAI